MVRCDERFNCCACCSPPPPPPPPACTANPGAPSLINPADGYTTNDTNVVAFSWSANGWGEAACGNRAFRLQVDNDNDWSNGNIYDSGNLTEATTSRNVTLNQPEGTYRWRVGAQNEVNGFIWSATRTFTLDYQAPTARITIPNASPITLGLNVTQTFTANAADAGGALTRMQLGRETSAGVFVEFLDDPGGVADEACSGGICSLTRQWTPDTVGTWVVYVNAYDNLAALGGRCTGSIIIPGGWDDCSRSGGLDAITVVVSNTTPSAGSITGPSTLRVGGAAGYAAKDYTGLFNLRYSDANKQTVSTTWNAATMTQENIDHIDIVARGDFGVGAWPQMQLVLSQPNSGANPGQRLGPSCTWTVNSNVNQTYSCNLDQATSSLDIIFPNDAFGGVGDDRNLRVDYIDIHFDASGTNFLRVQAEDGNINGNYVIYDEMTGGVYETAFDGLDRTGAAPALVGQEGMWRSSSLRFPIPLSFSPVPPTSLVTLTGTATDSLGANNSATKDITVCGSPPTGGLNNPVPAVDEQDVPRPVNLEWDGPTGWGSTCGAGSNTHTIYYRTKINPNCEVPIPDGLGGYTNYTTLPSCTNIADTGGRQSCLDGVNAFDRNTEYCWFVQADNNESTYTSYQSTGIVWYFETEDPMDGKDWMTVIGGDLYAGGIEGGGGNPMELLDPAEYHVTWTPPYLTHEGTDGLPVSSLSDLDMDIVDLDPTPNYFPESQSGFLAENTRLTNTWPPNFTGQPPADAVSLPRGGESCDDIFIHNPPSSPALQPGEAYEADVACVQDGLDNYGGNYRLQNPGVVALYVTGSGELRFTNSLLTANDRYRIVFVTGQDVDVRLDRNLASPDPVDKATLTPQIEAAFVIAGTSANPSTFEFEGTNDGIDDPDTTIVVEGPIIGRSVRLERDRGLSNFFPSEIIMYNPYYLYDLTRKEREGVTGVNNYTGLFVVDVDWIAEE